MVNRCRTHKETVGHPVCDDEARIWDDSQGLGVHGKTPADRTRRKDVGDTGEFAVIDVR